MAFGKSQQLIAPAGEENVTAHEKGTRSLLCDDREGGIDFN